MISPRRRATLAASAVHLIAMLSLSEALHVQDQFERQRFFEGSSLIRHASATTTSQPCKAFAMFLALSSPSTAYNFPTPAPTWGSQLQPARQCSDRSCLASVSMLDSGDKVDSGRDVVSDPFDLWGPKPSALERTSSLELATAASSRGSTAEMSATAEKYELEDQRWVQLAILASLALLSDWVCFATAAVPNEWQFVEGHEASELVDIFLFANVASCFFYTDVAAFFGLQKVIFAAASLMAAGCWLRSGVPLPNIWQSMDELARTMPGYNQQIVGTVLVGIAQPFFQCSPPLLSASWFGPSERALATATAINFNQVGIATSFVVGGLMANTAGGMHEYFDVISISSTLLAFATIALFRERPASPPSASAAAAWKAESTVDRTEFKLSYPGKAIELLKTKGFIGALVAFVASIGTTNVVSTFTASELARAGFPEGFDVDIAGAEFQVAIVLGGIFLGRYVDTTKRFKPAMLSCLAASVGLLAALGISEGIQTNLQQAWVVGLLLALGAAIGPVQPIAAELAVEVAYPCDENAVEATQQLAGNLFSFLLIPLCVKAAAFDFEGINTYDVRGDTLILLALVGCTTVFFSGFEAPLQRTLLDEAEEEA